MSSNGHAPRQLIPLGFRAADNRQQYRCQCCGAVLVECLEFAPLAEGSALRLACGRCKTPHTWTITRHAIEFCARPTAQGLALSARYHAHDRAPIDRAGD